MQKVLDFWFRDAFKTILKDGKKITSFDESLTKDLYSTWFGSSPETDLKISTEFKNYLLELGKQNLSATDPKETLSKIIVLDQFSRNIFRNSKEMFDFDQKALQLSLDAIERGLDKTLDLHPIQKTFFYLPLEHSEDLKFQEKSLELYTELSKNNPEFSILQGFVKYAQEHYDLIKKFNRFPHRNLILNRTNTKEEEEYLKTVSNVFGVSTRN